MTRPDFDYIEDDSGTAVPLWDHALVPDFLDEVLGTSDLRETWQEANRDGEALYRDLVEKRGAWLRENPERDFSDRAKWLFSCDKAVRAEQAAVTAATRRSARALRAYYDGQRAALPTAKAAIAEAWLEADEVARDAVAVLDDAIERREKLARYLPAPEASARPGRGHFVHDFRLGTAKDPLASPQREAIRIVVDVAPREIVADFMEAAK